MAYISLIRPRWSDQDIRVEISLTDLKYASFTLGYKVHNGPVEADKVAVTAETVLAPFRYRVGAAAAADRGRARLSGAGVR